MSAASSSAAATATPSAAPLLQRSISAPGRRRPPVIVAGREYYPGDRIPVEQVNAELATLRQIPDAQLTEEQKRRISDLGNLLYDRAASPVPGAAPSRSKTPPAR